MGQPLPVCHHDRASYTNCDSTSRCHCEERTITSHKLRTHPRRSNLILLCTNYVAPTSVGCPALRQVFRFRAPVSISTRRSIAKSGDLTTYVLSTVGQFPFRFNLSPPLLQILKSTMISDDITKGIDIGNSCRIQLRLVNTFPSIKRGGSRSPSQYHNSTPTATLLTSAPVSHPASARRGVSSPINHQSVCRSFHPPDLVIARSDRYLQNPDCCHWRTTPLVASSCA